jgi:hypothetical protein
MSLRACIIGNSVTYWHHCIERSDCSETVELARWSCDSFSASRPWGAVVRWRPVALRRPCARNRVNLGSHRSRAAGSGLRRGWHALSPAAAQPGAVQARAKGYVQSIRARTAAAVGCRRLFGWGGPTSRRQTSLSAPGCPCRNPIERSCASYLITSFAWNRSVGEIVRPSSCAVLRLMTSSNFIGCSTGRSPGLAPFRILSTYVAARRNRSV